MEIQQNLHKGWVEISHRHNEDLNERLPSEFLLKFLNVVTWPAGTSVHSTPQIVQSYCVQYKLSTVKLLSHSYHLAWCRLIVSACCFWQKNWFHNKSPYVS